MPNWIGENNWWQIYQYYQTNWSPQNEPSSVKNVLIVYSCLSQLVRQGFLWKSYQPHAASQRKFEPPRDKTNKMTVRPAKTQISLGIRPVWSESSLCAQWVAKDPSFLHADSEDSDQTGRMPRLIWVFAGRTTTLLVLSWGGSFVLSIWAQLTKHKVMAKNRFLV